MFVKSASSLAHTGLRTIVRIDRSRVAAPRTARRLRGSASNAGAEPAIQEAAIRQKPADGR